MPELAEVEFYRKRWAAAQGERVVGVRTDLRARVFRGSDVAAMAEVLKGKVFREARAHGKQMLFRFGPGVWLGAHLGMTGRLEVAGKRHEPRKHEHLVLHTGRRSLVFTDSRMFGRIRFHAGGEPEWWTGLPPQPHEPGFNRERLDAILARRARSPLKAVLLLQDFFPGVGNWMADEILWRTRIRPDTPAGGVGPRKRAELHRVIREVCDDALRVIGSDWSRPPDTWLFNHRWADGGRCPKTGRLLRREQIGGRTTCWSPTWQRG